LVVITALLYSVPQVPIIFVKMTEETDLYPIQWTLGFSIYTIFDTIVVYLLSIRYFNGDFQFTLSHKCITEAKETDEEAEKISHLIDRSSSYNKYLNRNFDLQFDEARVASNIISSSPDEKTTVVDIEESFRNDSNKLKPSSCLSRHANLEPKEQFLTAKHLSVKINKFITVLAAIIPVVIAVIQFAYPQP